MNNGFELFKRKHSNKDAIRISLYKSGSIGIGVHAYRQLGEPKYVTLWFDREKQIIGIKPAEIADKHAFITNPHSGNISISLKSFCRYYKIEHAQTRHYDAEVKDGMLLIPLNQ